MGEEINQYSWPVAVLYYSIPRLLIISLPYPLCLRFLPEILHCKIEHAQIFMFYINQINIQHFLPYRRIKKVCFIVAAAWKKNPSKNFNETPCIPWSGLASIGPSFWRRSMQPADIATLINLRVTFLVGVGELQPVMSLSTSTECLVPLPAVVLRSKEEVGLNGEGSALHKPTAALGQHSHTTAAGPTNWAESQTHSARRCGVHWFSKPVCVRDTTFGGEMACAEGGITFQNSEYQKMLDFTVGGYFVSYQASLMQSASSVVLFVSH